MTLASLHLSPPSLTHTCRHSRRRTQASKRCGYRCCMRLCACVYGARVWAEYARDLYAETEYVLETFHIQLQNFTLDRQPLHTYQMYNSVTRRASSEGENGCQLCARGSLAGERERERAESEQGTRSLLQRHTHTERASEREQERTRLSSRSNGTSNREHRMAAILLSGREARRTREERRESQEKNKRG